MTLSSISSEISSLRSFGFSISLSMIENMGRDKISLLAKALNISPLVLLDMDEDIYKSAGIDIMYAPLYDKLCCGNGGFVDDNIIEMIPIPSKGLNEQKEYFCQYAEGESMKDAGINDGDLLVFEKTDKVDYGVIGCFCTEDNVATCKKLTEMNGIMMLQPMNSNFDAIPIDPLNNNVRCIGKLKKVIKDFDWED